LKSELSNLLIYLLTGILVFRDAIQIRRFNRRLFECCGNGEVEIDETCATKRNDVLTEPGPLPLRPYKKQLDINYIQFN